MTEEPHRLTYEDLTDYERSEIYFRMYLNHMGREYMAEQLEVSRGYPIENSLDLVDKIIEEGDKGNIPLLGPGIRIKKRRPPRVEVEGPPSFAALSALEVFEVARQLPIEELEKLRDWIDDALRRLK